MKINDEYAFPSVIPYQSGAVGPVYFQGMTLRDYFAGEVLQGIHARDSFDPGQASPTQRAHLAYIDADAMLAERAK